MNASIFFLIYLYFLHCAPASILPSAGGCAQGALWLCSPMQCPAASMSLSAVQAGPYCTVSVRLIALKNRPNLPPSPTFTPLPCWKQGAESCFDKQHMQHRVEGVQVFLKRAPAPKDCEHLLGGIVELHNALIELLFSGVADCTN